MLAKFAVGGVPPPDGSAAKKEEILRKIQALEQELAALKALVESLNSSPN